MFPTVPTGPEGINQDPTRLLANVRNGMKRVFLFGRKQWKKMGNGEFKGTRCSLLVVSTVLAKLSHRRSCCERCHCWHRMWRSSVSAAPPLLSLGGSNWTRAGEAEGRAISMTGRWEAAISRVLKEGWSLAGGAIGERD